MRRNRVGLLVALGADSAGSGLFLPVVLLYVTRVVGVPLAVAVAGSAVAAGTVAGLGVPALAGRWIEWARCAWWCVPRWYRRWER